MIIVFEDGSESEVVFGLRARTFELGPVGNMKIAALKLEKEDLPQAERYEQEFLGKYFIEWLEYIANGKSAYRE